MKFKIGDIVQNIHNRLTYVIHRKSYKNVLNQGVYELIRQDNLEKYIFSSDYINTAFNLYNKSSNDIEYKVGDIVQGKKTGDKYSIVRYNGLNRTFIIESQKTASTFPKSLETLKTKFIRISPDLPNRTPRNICQHNWREYIGFTHVYEYCTDCDLKRIQ